LPQGRKPKDCIQNISKAKKGWGMVQVVKCLPRKYDALSSKSRLPGKTEGKEEKEIKKTNLAQWHTLVIPLLGR
jgi:hypothetical protein